MGDGSSRWWAPDCVYRHENTTDHGCYIYSLSSCESRLTRRLNNCLSYVYNCDDQSCLHIFFRSSNIRSFIFSLVSSPSTGLLRSHMTSYQLARIAQLVEHCTGIVEVIGSNTVQAWIFFRLTFHNCLSRVYNCHDQSSFHIRTTKKFFIYTNFLSSPTRRADDLTNRGRGRHFKSWFVFVSLSFFCF